MSSQQQKAAEKITNRIKGLREQLQVDETPVFSIPAIWDDGRQRTSSTPCDVILTNRRVMGFYMRNFPRTYIFIDALDLADLTGIIWRQKQHEPIFREILLTTSDRDIYIRAPKQKSEGLYRALQGATGPIGSKQKDEQKTEPAEETQETESQPEILTAPVPEREANAIHYQKQEIRVPFDRSVLGIILLFIGGIILEILGVWLWTITQNPTIGLPPVIAGFIAVITAIVTRRQQRAP